MATNGTTNGTSDGIHPKITFYTNHLCPWAHRADITLKELGLPYEEVIIDLNKPREEWYLKINPRGLVPSMRYSNGLIDEIITESAIVSQFLADAHPNPTFFPASHSSPTAPLVRARIAFFVDTLLSKVQSKVSEAARFEGSEQEKEEKAAAIVDGIRKEIEPLLEKGPFFGGSKGMTLAEALTAPFIIRLQAYMQHSDLLPPSLNEQISSALPNFNRWSKLVCEQESVKAVFDGPDYVARTMQKMAMMRAKAKA